MEQLDERVQGMYNGLFSIVWKILGIGLLLILFLIARTIYLLHSVRKIRQMKDPRTTNPLSSLSSVSAKPLKTLVVLGSGGHTTEILHLIKNLNPDRYAPMVLVVATTDTTSLQRVQAYPHSLPIKNKDNLIEHSSDGQVYRIPRSREVGQSYSSSILTTLYSLLFAFWLVGFQVRIQINIRYPMDTTPIGFSGRTKRTTFTRILLL